MNTDKHRFLYEDLMPHLLLQMVLTRPPVSGRASRDACDPVGGGDEGQAFKALPWEIRFGYLYGRA